MRRRTVLLVAAGAAVVVVAAGTLAVLLLRPDPVTVATTTLAQAHPVAAIAFSPDGRTLAGAETYGDKPVVRLWDYRAGTPTGEFPGSFSRPSLAFSPDGARLATGGYDSDVTVRDLASGQVTTLSTRAEKTTSIAFGPGRVASGGFDGVRLRDASTGADGPVLDGGERPVLAVAFSADGALLAGGGSDGVRLWNPATGALVATLGGHGDVASLAFSRDGNLLAAGGGDHRVRVWNVATFRLVHTLSGHRRTVTGVAFTPDGRTLASVDASSGDPKEDNEVMIRLWRVRTGTEIDALPVDGIDDHGDRCGPSYTVDTMIAFSRDGTTLAANCSSGIRLWRLATIH